MVVPNYYDKFRCIGGKCKHNCCRGDWEIEVDDEALERFHSISGEFGERVLDSINEDSVFIRKNGQCPLLSEDGLCEMVKNGVELCVICDEYPRFTENYDGYVERGVSLSCEAAAKIILENDEKVCLGGESQKSDDELFSLLYSAREVIFGILQNRDIPVSKRMRLVLNYGEELQERINRNEYTHLEYTPVDKFNLGEEPREFIDFLTTLNVLDSSWLEVLEKSKNKSSEIPNSVEAEQIAVYFVYRYFLKSLFDCDALSKLKFMAVSVVSIYVLSQECGGLSESARRYSVEVEHNEDNIEAIYDEFLFNASLSTEHIISMIK